MRLTVNRRQFICTGALAVAGKAVGRSRAATAPEGATALRPLLGSSPVLQNAAETSVGVSFAVNADASGWVDYATAPDLTGATRVFSGGHGLMTVDDKVALVRLTGLKPATTYYYRIGADRISFKGGYEMKNLGAEVDPAVHSFTTLGAAATGGFCVINDTHDQKDAIAAVLKKVDEIKPACVIWNGDASNTSETIDTAIGIFLKTHPDFPDYAADTPYLFLNGNHDFRGRFNRRLGDLMMFRELAERKAEYAELGRNFVQRLGDIALIGLDTGEDKLDTNPLFAGIFKMQAYRELQARWLAEAIETPSVQTAKYKVAFCHIPLFDPSPTANPGDLAPADRDPRYRNDYAAWQRTCATLWGPLFKKAGVQLVVVAHQHRFRHDAPTPDRPWTQIVGGGCTLGSYQRREADGTLTKVEAPDLFPTVIEGKVEGGRLVVVVHNVLTGAVAGRYAFEA